MNRTRIIPGRTFREVVRRRRPPMDLDGVVLRESCSGAPDSDHSIQLSTQPTRLSIWGRRRKGSRTGGRSPSASTIALALRDNGAERLSGHSGGAAPHSILDPISLRASSPDLRRTRPSSSNPFLVRLRRRETLPSVAETTRPGRRGAHSDLVTPRRASPCSP